MPDASRGPAWLCGGAGRRARCCIRRSGPGRLGHCTIRTRWARRASSGVNGLRFRHRSLAEANGMGSDCPLIRASLPSAPATSGYLHVLRSGSTRTSGGTMETRPELWPASSRATLVRPLCEMRCDDRIHQEAMASPQGEGCRASHVYDSGTFVWARNRRCTAHNHRTKRGTPNALKPSWDVNRCQ
jgi:hypothetical protein